MTTLPVSLSIWLDNTCQQRFPGKKVGTWHAATSWSCPSSCGTCYRYHYTCPLLVNAWPPAALACISKLKCFKIDGARRCSATSQQEHSGKVVVRHAQGHSPWSWRGNVENTSCVPAQASHGWVQGSLWEAMNFNGQEKISAVWGCWYGFPIQNDHYWCVKGCHHVWTSPYERGSNLQLPTLRWHLGTDSQCVWHPDAHLGHTAIPGPRIYHVRFKNSKNCPMLMADNYNYSWDIGYLKLFSLI